jgi:hypothetical protein
MVISLEQHFDDELYWQYILNELKEKDVTVKLKKHRLRTL